MTKLKIKLILSNIKIRKPVSKKPNIRMKSKKDYNRKAKHKKSCDT
jgi:hypothetical protein